jgi:hypothetical protein
MGVSGQESGRGNGREIGAARGIRRRWLLDHRRDGRAATAWRGHRRATWYASWYSSFSDGCKCHRQCHRNVSRHSGFGLVRLPFIILRILFIIIIDSCHIIHLFCIFILQHFKSTPD